jgi:hypothetical protein
MKAPAEPRTSLKKSKAQGGWTAYDRLDFVTPSRRIVAEAPAGSEPELMKVRDGILHARELSLNEPQSDVSMTVEGAAAVADRLGSKFPRLKEGLPSRALFFPSRSPSSLVSLG